MIKDALYTFQELAEVNGQSGKLLALQAVASLRLGRSEEASELIAASVKAVQPFAFILGSMGCK